MFYKNLHKILAGGIAIITALTPMSAFAADNTYSVTSAGNKSVSVSYVQNSTFEVTIPKTITLGTDKDADYTVTVTGDIDAAHYVKVVPDSTFDLSDTSGKNDVEASVSQDKVNFTYDEINGSGGSSDGTVSAENLTAGSWSGSLDFNISLNELLATYTVSWDEALSSFGTYIGDDIDVDYDITTDDWTERYNVVFYSGYSKVRTTTNSGGKRITYTNAYGETAYANPYEAGSINAVQGSAILFEMFGGVDDTEAFGNIGICVNDSFLYDLWGYGHGELNCVGFALDSDETITRKTGYSEIDNGTEYYWYIIANN